MAYLHEAVLLRCEGDPPTKATAYELNQHRVCITELLTAGFMGRSTRFGSAGEFLAASGLDPRGLVDLDPVVQGRWDAFVREASTFPNWNAMLKCARGEWIFRRIGIAPADCKGAGWAGRLQWNDPRGF
jgi:hypothetical protein